MKEDTTLLPTLKKEDPGTCTLELEKSNVNTMDVGSITFTVTLSATTKWGKDGLAHIMFPTYYRADLGDSISC